jgi:RNA polymerase sigma-70 factor (ECF subfamily)
MRDAALDRTVREAGGRIVAALAARFRDLDIAEEAFAEACVQAAEAWREGKIPRDVAGWIYRVAERRALDALRRRITRERLAPEAPWSPPTAEELMMDDSALIPDERLRLIFVCCHPAVAVDARAALTLRLVCGLSVEEIARAFLISEPTLAQRLVRAKRKIADAGVPFEVPRPEAWADRLDAVLSTVEVAYAKAHEDAAGSGAHAGYASELLGLTRVLAELLPGEAEGLALAAIVRFAEARRPARLDISGAMVPLSDQDPGRWRRPLIDEAEAYLQQALALGTQGSRTLQAAIHGAWYRRRSLAEPPPWPEVLALYDRLLAQRDDVIVRINRAVALADVMGATAALAEVECLRSPALDNFLPYHALRADLLRRAGRTEEARAAYDAALSLGPASAERIWLQRQRRSLATR